MVAVVDSNDYDDYNDKMKDRLDNLLVLRGLAESKEQAQRMILAGSVRVHNSPNAKAGQKFADDIAIEVVARPRFVSRGGEKLEGAFEAFGLNVEGLDCLDVGASTGGFTDCLLQHGAKRVISLDVGKNQFHPRLRNDPRVTVIEGFNARYMTVADLPYSPQFAVTDVSFISLRLILPPIVAVLPPASQIISLIKPQFEAGREHAPKGVVRDPAVHQKVVDDICAFARDTLRLDCLGIERSPLLGPEGNVEFLAWWRTPIGAL